GVQQIYFDQAEIVVAGGTESMRRSPIYLRNSRFGGDRTTLVDSNSEAGQQPTEIYGQNLGMGITDENVAEYNNDSMKAQDAHAVESQRRATQAINEGRFKNEIVPVQVKEKKQTFIVEQDEHPRPGTSTEKLAKLRPAFKENGTVTAGNTCG